MAASTRSWPRLSTRSWRRLLAIHTSNAVRPGHVGGVVFTLEGCITHMPTASVTGGAACELVLPNLFLQCTPPHAWVVHAEAETVEKAEEECCMQTFLFCLGAGPDLVRLHDSTLRNSGRIRYLGRRLQATALAVASSIQGGMPWLEAAQQAVAALSPGGQGWNTGADPAPSVQGSSNQLQSGRGPLHIASRHVAMPSVDDEGFQTMSGRKRAWLCHYSNL